MNFDYFFQIILQEIDDANQQVTDERSLTVFIRRWNPSTMTLGSFNEVTIYGELTITITLLELEFSKYRTFCTFMAHFR